MLVVGQRAAGDIMLRPDGRVTLGLVAQNNHKLSRLGAVGARAAGRRTMTISGASSRRRAGAGAATGDLDYLDDTEYVACLVPAFTADGDDSWNGTQPVTCDLYDCWTFRTGPKGDFRDLAAKLHKADLDAIQQTGGKPFGRAEVTYRIAHGPAKTTLLPTAGALKLPPGRREPDPADAAAGQPDRAGSDGAARCASSRPTAAA